MKKKAAAGILIILVLTVFCLFSANAEEQLPPEIENSLSGMEITDSAYWDSPDSVWFVLAKTPEGTNTLYCFTITGSEWTENFSTTAAIPQGENKVTIHISDRSVRFSPEPEQVFDGPILIIEQYGTGEYEESIVVNMCYQRVNGDEWKLFSAFFWQEQMSLDVDDEKIIFSKAIDHDRDEVYIFQGEIERDLRKTDFETIPRTPDDLNP